MLCYFRVKMPPKTRADTCKPLIGQPDSVLRLEFLQANQERKDDTDVLPFSGKLQLPSREQVLKLYLFYRAQPGSSNDTQKKISSKVAAHVVKYWEMAGYETVVSHRVESHINKEVDKYQKINKNRKRENQTEVKKRQDYLSELNKLFDIATPQLEAIINKNRLLGKDEKSEYISFLLDQRGDRKMVMAERDIRYEAALQNSTQRKQRKEELLSDWEQKCCLSSTSDLKDGDSSSEDNEDDDDWKLKDKKKQKSDTVLIELPRDIMNSFWMTYPKSKCMRQKGTQHYTH